MPQVLVQTTRLQRGLQKSAHYARIRPIGECPANAPVWGPYGDRIQV